MDNDTFSLVKKWIKDGDDVTEFFFLHILKVILKVVVTTLYFLHKDFFQNAPVCKQFKEFICSEMYERIPTESFSVVGKVGECELSLIIMPLTVEPTKPRLCHDDSNINL